MEKKKHSDKDSYFPHCATHFEYKPEWETPFFRIYVLRYLQMALTPVDSKKTEKNSKFDFWG